LANRRLSSNANHSERAAFERALSVDARVIIGLRRAGTWLDFASLINTFSEGLDFRKVKLNSHRPAGADHACLHD
jgi:hypothetical protein